MLAAVYPIERAVAHHLASDIGEGPTYISQERVGITIEKLRTMRGADDSSVPDSLHQGGPLSNPRIASRFAARVRLSRLDELPQIRQVVAESIANEPNRLSLVGLRPLLKRHADEFWKIAKDTETGEDKGLADRWRGLWAEEAPKGVTGPAALEYAVRNSNADIDPFNWVKLEDEYCRNASSGRDVEILAKTGLLLVRMGLKSLV